MDHTATSHPNFHISHDEEPSQVLIAGFSSFGLAGLTAADFIVDYLELEETGHLTVEGLPSVTPFLEGRPRHHTRLFSRPDLDVTILVGELFVPADYGMAFSNTILDWMEQNGVQEIAVLAGVPIAHGPDEHRAFYVATDDYREARLQTVDIPPMGRGFFGGTNAALVERGIGSPLGVGVYVTPVHAQVPDVEAAIRLVDAVNEVYELGVDSHPLESFADEVRQYYAELADRLEESESELPEDRMYM
ncbi:MULTISPECIES: proteasome assembly chaperone family protein [Haloferax]|uniref:Proteasome assembly chaperone family protein n=1 Tax=Haloferax marinum TaxID=2666143 RepID=A0A6A8GB27_9EURY|nr:MULTISPECIES: PAC2 family protein [Haloferax]KAB1198725.1 proteasome assembly chaperone family protein [Haloferax sp. CBA1150]MRW97842.1 proteasome assembly chaperone family protein [Haloferax marinum]